MNVVGISGAQGGGKSSLLAELKIRGWRVDDFKVSRAVQAQLGWDTLERVMDDPLTMQTFQNEVIRQKYNRDMVLGAKMWHEFEPREKGDDEDKSITLAIGPHTNRDHYILTERTFADIYAYTALWTWKFVDRGQLQIPDAMSFLVEYTRRCREFHNTVYRGVVLLPLMDHVPWQDDTNRAKKEDASRVYEDVEMFVEKKQGISIPRMTITKATVSDRADQVAAWLEKL